MSKIAGICERIKKLWQSYNLWVFVALVFLFVLICWIADHANGSYRHLNTASIVVSIVLSLVVIGYALAQNIKADIAQDRMERLVERVEDRIQLVGKDIDQVKDALNNPATQVGDKEPQANVEDGGKYIGEGEVYLSFLGTSDIARLFAYFLLKSNKLNKALSIDLIIPIIRPLLKMPPSEVATYVLGILQGMSCGLDGYLNITEQKNVHLERLPKDFEKHMEIVIKWMKTRSPHLGKSLEQIDYIII